MKNLLENMYEDTLRLIPLCLKFVKKMVKGSNKKIPLCGTSCMFQMFVIFNKSAKNWIIIWEGLQAKKHFLLLIIKRVVFHFTVSFCHSPLDYSWFEILRYTCHNSISAQLRMFIHKYPSIFVDAEMHLVLLSIFALQ